MQSQGSKDKAKERQRRFHERHPGYASTQASKWRKENPERFKAAVKARAELNKEQFREYANAYYHKNREKINERNKARLKAKRAANPKRKPKLSDEERKARQKDWQKAHRKEMAERSRKYYWENREKIRAWNKSEEGRAYSRLATAKRRALIISSGGAVTQEEIEALFKRQGGKCATPTCRVRLKRGGLYGMHIDHVIPLSKGGCHEIGNIALLCSACNWSKNDCDPEEWAKRHGVLFV